MLRLRPATIFPTFLLAALLIPAPRALAATNGNGVVEPSEQCDPPASSCPGHTNGIGGCDLYVDGDPESPTCSTGNDCFFAGSCCKFNTQFVGQGAPCSDGNDCTTGDVCGNVGQCLQGSPVVDLTPCDDGLFCNGGDSCASGQCANHVGDPCLAAPECQRVCNESSDACISVPGASCSDDGNPCTSDVCDGTSTCIHPAGNLGATCRAANDICDIAETCTGSSATCPGDSFQPASSICRAAAGVCDVAESCTGAGAACPGDTKSTDECRPAAGPCDLADFCTGSEDSCPGDAKSTAVCRPPVNGCDLAESCNGSSNSCPADAGLPGGNSCDDANGCTLDSVCDGNGGCVGGTLAPTGTSCDDGNRCTLASTCAAGECFGGASVFGERRARLGVLSRVHTDVQVGAGPLRLEKQAEMDDGTSVSAPRIALAYQAKVDDAYGELKLGKGFVTGTTSPVPLSVPAGMCPEQTISCGGDNVVVPFQGSTHLPPGTYNEVYLFAESVLQLDEGEYNFCDFRSETATALEILPTGGTPVVRVQGTLRMGQYMRVGPTPGAKRPTLVAGKKAVSATAATIDANIAVPTGSLTIGVLNQVDGTICARTLRVFQEVDLACSVDD